MKNTNFSRRKFIKGTLSTGLLAAGSGMLSSFAGRAGKDDHPVYNAKGLPTAMLGVTGVRIPRIAMGLGSRFCTIRTSEESQQLLNYALDNGLYYWDTAHIYENTDLKVISEERIGEVLKYRRKEIFLSTKVTSRDPDEAMRQIEGSLKRLNTGHLDMLKIHDVQSVADVEKLSEKGNLIDMLMKLKEQGVTRFIGFSGHSEALAMKQMADKGVFDSMLMAMNHWGGNVAKRQELVIPAAKSKQMGVMLMKVVRPRETVKELVPADLVRYALSLQGPDGIVLGMDNLEVVKSNLDILRNFSPLSDDRIKELAQQLTPFYRHENLPWMRAGYRDGGWA